MSLVPIRRYHERQCMILRADSAKSLRNAPTMISLKGIFVTLQKTKHVVEPNISVRRSRHYLRSIIIIICNLGGLETKMLQEHS